MANTLKFGNGQWATQEGLALAYNDENDNYKPLPFDFTRASTATRVNKQGLIETIESGLPRIDYLNNTNGALLLEPQRTNAITNSDSFGSTGWSFVTTGSAIAPIVTDNYAISPDGTQNAQRIQFNLGGGNPSRSVIRQNIATQTDWFLSVYMKSTNGQEQKILWHSTSDSNETTVTGEWQRFTFSRNGISNSWAGLGLNAGVSSVDTADILVYGFQAEQGSYATSFIPTSGSAVTRAAETCIGAGNDQVINSTEGTIYAEQKSLETNFTYNYFVSVSDGTNNNRLEIRQSATGFQFLWRVGGTYQSQIVKTNAPFTSAIKFALIYSSTDIKFYVNGSLVGTINSPTLYATGTLDNIEFADGSGSNNFRGIVKECKYYNTALTDAQAIALTS